MVINLLQIAPHLLCFDYCVPSVPEELVLLKCVYYVYYISKTDK